MGPADHDRIHRALIFLVNKLHVRVEWRVGNVIGGQIIPTTAKGQLQATASEREHQSQ